MVHLSLSSYHVFFQRYAFVILCSCGICSKLKLNLYFALCVLDAEGVLLVSGVFFIEMVCCRNTESVLIHIGNRSNTTFIVLEELHVIGKVLIPV